jgi:hypothetical protein
MNSDVFQKLQIIKPVTKVENLQQLKTVRLENEFQLPDSYCNFAANFGFGILCDLFYIFIPAHTEENLFDRSQDLKMLIHDTLEAGMVEEFYHETTPDSVRKLIPFGISKNGDTLAWNPDESVFTDENVIYSLSPKMVGVRRCADTLYDFIEGCLDKRIKKMMGVGFNPLPPTFEPL